MTSEGMGEMFEGDSAYTCGKQIPLTSMGDRAEGVAFADPGARAPIGVSGNCCTLFLLVTDQEAKIIKMKSKPSIANTKAQIVETKHKLIKL